MKRILKHKVLLWVCCLLTTASCSEVECPLDSVVVMTCRIYDAESDKLIALQDTLTISPVGKDTVLLNQAFGVNEFVLPLKMAVEADTFLLKFSSEWDMYVTDTLIVQHTNQPHFESVDCPTSIFHKIKSVVWSKRENSTYPLIIDNVSITRELVDYNNVENLKITLRNRF